MRKFQRAKMILLMICGSIVSSCTPETKSPQLICPPLEQYTSEQQEIVVQEFTALIRANTAPTMRLFIVHYRQLRARLQAAGCN